MYWLGTLSTALDLVFVLNWTPGAVLSCKEMPACAIDRPSVVTYADRVTNGHGIGNDALNDVLGTK